MLSSLTTHAVSVKFDTPMLDTFQSFEIMHWKATVGPRGLLSSGIAPFFPQRAFGPLLRLNGVLEDRFQEAHVMGRSESYPQTIRASSEIHTRRFIEQD